VIVKKEKEVNENQLQVGSDVGFIMQELKSSYYNTLKGKKI
jgi:hypothetical protein